MGHQYSEYLAVSNRFRDLLAVPGVNGYGSWESFTWENRGNLQHAARLVPEQAPWRGLFDALDAEGKSVPDEPVPLEDEADAIVACCWRYGSYAHVLTGGELYPEFRTNPKLSRISDDEMMRINLEFSSGLAAWWSDRASDPTTIHCRVRAALRLLPMPWRTSRPDWWQDYLQSCAHGWKDRVGGCSDELLKQLPSLASSQSLRGEANYLVNAGYRNGPIESIHGGRWSHGSEIPGFLRLYAPDIKRIGRESAERIAIYLYFRELDNVRDLQSLLASLSPSHWSVTDETAPVEYPGMSGAGPLGPRLRWLAQRYPTVYGSAANLSKGEASG